MYNFYIKTIIKEKEDIIRITTYLISLDKDIIDKLDWINN